MTMMIMTIMKIQRIYIKNACDVSCVNIYLIITDDECYALICESELDCNDKLNNLYSMVDLNGCNHDCSGDDKNEKKRQQNLDLFYEWQMECQQLHVKIIFFYGIVICHQIMVVLMV